MKSDVVRRVKRLFERHFGTSAQAVGCAPGRVNLIGEHVDYCGGLVLPVALERVTAVAVEACQDREGVEVVSEAGPHEGGSNVYVEGVAALWRAWVKGQGDGGQQLGNGGLRVAIASDVPVGAGLSSSAALEVATACALSRLGGWAWEWGSGGHIKLEGRVEMWRKVVSLCREAEHVYAGVPCGIMDQYVSVFGVGGHAILIDCEEKSDGRVEHREVPLGGAGNQARVVVADCGVRHALNEGGYAQRRRACERALAEIQQQARERGVGKVPVNLRRSTLEDLARVRGLDAEARACATHVIEECQRTLDTADALEKGDLELAGRWMDASHVSLRDLFKVSCVELDRLVELARRLPGVVGARMTGGGFGGCIVALVDGHGDTRAIVETLRVKGGSPLVFESGAGEGAMRLYSEGTARSE